MFEALSQGRVDTIVSKGDLERGRLLTVWPGTPPFSGLNSTHPSAQCSQKISGDCISVWPDPAWKPKWYPEINAYCGQHPNKLGISSSYWCTAHIILLYYICNSFYSSAFGLERGLLIWRGRKILPCNSFSKHLCSLARALPHQGRRTNNIMEGLGRM